MSQKNFGPIQFWTNRRTGQTQTVLHVAFCMYFLFYFILLCYVVGSFRPRYGSVEPSEMAISVGNLDNSVFEDASNSPVLVSAAPRAMFDEDQDSQSQAPNNEPPPMHRSKSSLGAQSRGTTYLH